MKVAFRVDAASWIGSGHLMRCLTLAKRLRGRGAEVSFICRDLPGQMNAMVAAAGFVLHRLPAIEMGISLVPPPSRRGLGGGDGLAEADIYNAVNFYHHPPAPSWKEGEIKIRSEADWLAVTPALDAEQSAAIIAALGGVQWLIVDHYGIDQRWESAMRRVAGSIMVIDDLANRRHDCDLLLDQNLLPDMERRYQTLIPKGCRPLLGPRYALLRDEFITAMQQRRVRDGRIKNVLLFMGGMDPADVTGSAVRGLMALPDLNMVCDVIVGTSNPHREALAGLCRGDRRFTLATQVDDMASRLNQSDLVIGAAGSTSWERCLLGVPSVVVVMAENQRPIAEALQQRGAVVAVSAETVAATVAALMQQPQRVSALSQAALAVMADYSDGAGEVAALIHDGGDDGQPH